MSDQDPRYIKLLDMKGLGMEVPDPAGWADMYKLAYKRYEFNRIKWNKTTTFKRFNMKGNMFSQKEAQFILDSAEADLANLIKQQDALIQEISRHGERLGKMREARECLEGIVGKLKAAMKREEDEDEDED